MKRNRLACLLVLAVLWSTPAAAQVTITYSFTNGSAADADQVNANFSVLGSQALNRTGGTITGNIAVSNGVTIDGIDLSALLGGTGAGVFASLDVAGAAQFGSGNVNLIQSDGRIPGISSTYFASTDGSQLTGIRPDALTGTGFVPSSAVLGTYANQLLLTNTLNEYTGWNITILNASSLGAATAGSLLAGGAIHGGSLIADTSIAAGGAITGSTLVTASTIRAAGGYLSADSTPGFTGSCAPATTATVKNGLITGCS